MRTTNVALAALLVFGFISAASAATRSASTAWARDVSADHRPMRTCGAIQTACLPWQAPIGHRQPAITDVRNVPPLPSDQELQALDRAIDERLTICRGC